MNKTEFLNALKHRLQEYPSEETKASVEYYTEMIDDRVEDGMSEEEAVASLGPVDQIANQIKCELPLTTLVKQKTKEKTNGKRMPVWAIILLILGFPLWGGVVVAILSMVLSLYITIWGSIVALWAICFSFGAFTLTGIIGFFVSLFRASFGSALMYLGIGLGSAGIGIFLYFGCLLLTKGVCSGTKWCFLQLKKSLVGKEE